jgi:hypothetical protein
MILASIKERLSGFLAANAPVTPAFSFDARWRGDWTGLVTVEEVFFRFEEPLLYSSRFGPVTLLFLKVSEKDGADVHLASVVDEAVLAALRENRLSVRGAVLQGLRHVVTMRHGQVDRHWDVGAANVPGKWLPEKGVALDRLAGPVSDVIEGKTVEGSFRIGGEGFELRLSPSSAPVFLPFLERFLPVWRRMRHRKRGSTYEVFCDEVSIQTDRPIVEGDRIVVYVGEKGDTWGRLVTEVADGRFEDVSSRPGSTP